MTMKVLPWRTRLIRPEAKRDEQARWLLRSEGLLLASVPVLGTMLALMFEWGFLSFYRIPLSVAALDVSHVVRASALTALGVAVLAFLRLVMYRLDNSSSILLRLVGSCWPWMWSAFFLVVLSPSYWWFPLAAIGAMVIGTVFNGWRAKRKNGRILSENILWILDRERERLPPGPAKWSPLGQAFFAVFCLFMSLSIVKSYGARAAEWREEYWVLKDEPTMAFVERYGEHLVFAKFDPSTKRLVGEAAIVKYGDVGVRMLLLRPGPLLASSRPSPTELNEQGK